jgi:ferredoxin-type protein NapH
MAPLAKNTADRRKREPRRQKIRHLIIFLSLLAFPVTMNFLSPYLIMQASFEGVLAGSGVVFILLLLQALFLGRLFCGWLCPAGGLNETLGTVNNRRVTGKGIRKIKYAIWIIWIGALAAGFISSGGPQRINMLYMTESGVSIDEPLKFITYFSVILIFLLISILVGRRASCHAICWMAPFMIIGLKLSDLLRLPRLHIESSPKDCTRCERCIQRCPMSIPVMEKLGQPLALHEDCCLCGECVDVCPKNCLRYLFSPVRKPKRKP